jgi:GNAT superfamily N-acetyltransferase
MHQAAGDEASRANGLSLRRAGLADAPVLADIHARSRAATYRGLLADDYLDLHMPAEMPGYWQARMQELSAGAGAAWIAERAGEAVAFACALAPDAQASVLVDNLHARPDRKGGGAGTLPLEAVAAWARTHGAQALHLLVIEGNDAAIGFYEHRGWRRSERLDDEMGGRPIVAFKYVLRLA